MAGRPSGRPAVQQAPYVSQYRPTPTTRTPQAAHQTTQPLNPSVQSRLPTPAYDRAGLPLAGASPTPGVSSSFTTPLADPGLRFRSNVPTGPSVTDYLMSALRPVLVAHQESTSARIDQIGSAIETLGLTVGNLSNQIKDVRKETQDQTKDAAGILERTHEVQLSTSRVLAARLAKLEKMIGTSDDRDDTKSLLNRLDTISYAVEELLERAKDPYAPLSGTGAQLQTDTDDVIDLRTPEPEQSKTYADVAVNPQTPEVNPRSYIDAEVDSRTPEPSPVLDTSSANEMYKDVAIDSRTPEPAPVRYEMGTSTIHQMYADAAIRPKTPEPLPPLPPRHDYGTSPVRQTYFNVAIGPQTPSPPISIRGSTHPNSSSTRRFSSGALTLLGDATDLEFKPSIRLMRNDVGPAQMSKVSSGTLGASSRSPTGSVQAHFTHAPTASQSLLPADWSTPEKAHQTSVSDDADDDEPDEPAPIFQPDSSPSATESFTLLKGQDTSPEGSVASLRLTALGDSLAGPTALSPPRAIRNIPVSSRPSISPPSPYSLSPSYSPHILSPRPQTPESPGTSSQSTSVGGRSRTTTPKSSSVRAVSSPVRMATPECAPISAQAGATNRTSEIPFVKTSPAHAVSHLVPAMTSTAALTLSPTPAPTSTQGSVDQIQDTLLLSSPKSQPVSPNSVEEEISVSQLITETSSLEAPLFVPDFPSPPQDSQNFGSPLHIDSPAGHGEPPTPEIPSSPYSPPLPIKSKPPLPRRPLNFKSPTKPSFIDLRMVKLGKARPSRDQSPRFAHVTTNTKPARTLHLPRASTSKATANSPIYVSSRSLSPVSDLTSQSESDDDVKVIPVKKKVKTEHPKSELPPPKKRLVVKDPLEKDSAATTRIKKRKLKLSDATSEPPLKRARQKAEVVKSEIIEIERKDFDSKAKGKGKEVKGKGKEIKGKSRKSKDDDAKGKYAASSTSSTSNTGKANKTKARTKPLPGSEWPPKSQAGGAKFYQKFVECELCYYWYHYGCVGIKPGDHQVGARDFICPPCSSNGANPLVPSRKGVVCARPDCGKASVDEFFVAGIIGRTTKVEGGRGRRYMWLLKWEGYSIKESTWEGEEAMSDPQKLIEEFTIAAEKEGFPDDPHMTILLEEAVSGGCVDPNA